MRQRIPRILLTLAVLTGLMLAGPQPPLWSALSADYTGVPPYISNVVTPNILLLQDNSASMDARVNCDPSVCIQQPDGSVIPTGPDPLFAPTTLYTGYFDSMRCYTYHDGTWNNDATDPLNRFEDGAAKTPNQVQGLCPATDNMWDGNLLNWITFRRIDAVKKALTGGDCAYNDIRLGGISRTLDGTCTPIGSPSKITIQNARFNNLEQVMQVSTIDQEIRRIPQAQRFNPPGTPMYILLRPSWSNTTYAGWFCILGKQPGELDLQDWSTCNLTITWVSNWVNVHIVVLAQDYWTDPVDQPVCDVYAEDICIASHIDHYPSVHIVVLAQDYWELQDQGHVDLCDCYANAAGFNVRLVVPTEPTGAIQQIGSKARFGLMKFEASLTPGGEVTVGIGSSQTRNQWGLWSWNTNQAAMIAGVELLYPSTGTPLAESLYTAARYIAQITPTYDTVNYTYPLAFGATALGGTGVGSIGPGEITALINPETCPAGYVTNACGRDPYFFGQNYRPAWASPSAVVSCCKTFVIILTDGAPTLDANIPDSLKEYAHTRLPSITQCTGSDTTIHDPAAAGPLMGICNGNPLTPPSLLLHEHKDDYPAGPQVNNHFLDDVALWAHTTDLRPDNGNTDDRKACDTRFGAILNITGIDEPAPCLPGTQNITLYTIYEFGNINGREILMQAARQGGFDDFNGDNKPDLTGQDCTDPVTHQIVPNGSSPEWDKVNNVTGRAEPDCIPDNYFESSNSDAIRVRLFDTITKLIETTSSSAAVSVLASSSSGEGMTYQAFFYQSKLEEIQLSWLGYLQGFFVDSFGNLREDTDGDGILKLTEDHIVKLRFEPSPHIGLPRTVADIWKDTNGTGIGDVQLPTVELSDLKPVWEAGRQLALTDAGASCGANTGGVTCRRILTWIDRNNDGIVDATERIEFEAASAASVARLCPYLGGREVENDPSACAGAGAGQDEAKGIIGFIRGCDPVTCPEQADLRDRRRTVDHLPNKIWKLGDIMGSTPVVAGAPRERYDVIYGDVDYATFYRRYQDRRQVVYAGANDGMLHAFNGGFLSDGVAADHERLRFLTTPRKPGSNDPCSILPCSASMTDPHYILRPGTPPSRGAELWAFVPQDLLPQLRWLTDASYSHIYYVDLKPKVTDARIFCNDQVAITSCIEGNHEDHPGGWGTILIGGFRFGGSCSNCTQGKGGARTVTATAGFGGTPTRVFLSSYFVLDITNPEKDPVLLWTFRDQDLGLTTAAPAIVRVNTVGGTSSLNEKWYVVFGTGMTHYDGSSRQAAQIFVVDLMLGPSYSAINQVTGSVRGKDCTVSPCIAANTATTVGLFSTAQIGFMGDAVTLDADLDFRVDAIYIGSTFCNVRHPLVASNHDSPCSGPDPSGGPVWKGAMWRITTNGGDTDLTMWGVSGAPTTLISTFTPNNVTCLDSTVRCSTLVGPIVAAPTLTIDKGDNFWVFFGTGRLIDSLDKGNSDTQNFFGVKEKDCIIANACSDQKERHNLFDVSRVAICTSMCADPTQTVSLDGTNFIEDTTQFVADVQTKDGWVTTLLAAERSLSKAALLGGTLFFSTFIPDESLCAFSGEGRLYGLNYLTGTGSTDAALGTTPDGRSQLIANASIDLGSGLPSEVSLQLGSKNLNTGPLAGGLSGATNTGKGCVGGITANMQMSNATIAQVCTSTGTAYSRIISWRDL